MRRIIRPLVVVGVILVCTMTQAQQLISLQVGIMKEGVPVVTVPYEKLNNLIASEAVNAGFVGARLIEQSISEGQHSYSYQYTYELIDGDQTYRLVTSLEVNIDKDVFTLVDGGVQVTCKSKNCNGCVPKGTNCTACNQDESQTEFSCEKTITSKGVNWEIWVATVISGIFTLLR